ncbi:hypothetical protein G9A89_005274 [Geosiphon pyriformis]|nr:hypothetical protein G9A89_005274 [Geosiphon pyriformis]
MKKFVKSFGHINSEEDVKVDVASRKKRKDGVLKDSAAGELVLFKKAISGSWGSKASDTIEFDNVDIEEKCLVEKTSVDYSKRSFFIKSNSNQTPKGLRLVTKKALNTLLGKINFLDDVDDNNIFLNTSPLKNLVNVSLVVVRKLFSKVNSFGGVFTLSKFLGIIYASFTSEFSLVQTTEKARAANILVNTDLKKLSSHSDRTVMVKEISVGISTETVHAVLSEFGIIKSIKMQLVKLWQKTVVKFEQLDYADLVAAEWSILIRKNAMHDFVRSVSGKTCIINRHPVIYAQVRCAVVCFDFTKSLNAVMGTILVLRGINLHWSNLMSVKCTKCRKLDHILLSCTEGGKISSGSLLCRVLLDTNKSRLAAIYVKQSVPVAPLVSFGGLFWAKIAGGSSFSLLSGQVVLLNIGSSSEMKPSLPVVTEINDRFATLKHSLTSFAEHVNMLAKMLEASEPTVSQLSSGC